MKQGEIWRINLDPTVGAEIRKSRPCLILNNDTIGKLPLKVIAPLTDFKEHYVSVPWMVIVDPDPGNGLHKRSVVDLFQVRSLSEKRFIERLGAVDEEALQRCREALCRVVK